MTNEEQVEVWNEIVHLVFMAKHGHEYDPTNPDDVAHRWAIMMWQCDGFPIPNEPGTRAPIPAELLEGAASTHSRSSARSGTTCDGSAT